MSCITIADIAASVVEAPGTSIGLGKEELLAAWAALCDSIRDSLMKRKAFVVPGFAEFCAARHQEHSGTWGVRLSWIPAVLLLPNFCSSYGVRNAPNMAAAHIGAPAAEYVNASVLSQRSGLPRYATMNALRDLCRELGEKVSRGLAVRVDLGCCELSFSAGFHSVRWSKAFVHDFTSANGEAMAAADPSPLPHPRSSRVSSTPSVSPRRPATARVAAATAAAATMVTAMAEAAGTPRANSGLGRSSGGAAAANHNNNNNNNNNNNKKTAQETKEAPLFLAAPPQRPSTARAAAAAAARPRLGNASAVPPPALPPPQQQQPQCPQPPTATAAVPAANQQAEPQAAVARTTQPAAAARAVESQSAGALPAARPPPPLPLPPTAPTPQQLSSVASSAAMSDYHRRKQRKTTFKRMRNKAYEESWEAQQAMRRAQAEEERAQDKASVEAFRRFLVEENNRAVKERNDRRQEDLTVENLNNELTRVRRPLQLPRVAPPGDIFNVRQRTYVATHDTATLKKQMEERRAREDQEREENRQYGLQSMQEAEIGRQREAAERMERRKMMEAAARDYEAQIEMKCQERDEYKRNLTNGGALLFSGTASRETEVAEVRTVKQHTRQIMDVNKEQMLRNAEQRAKEREAQRADHLQTQREFETTDFLLRQQQWRAQQAVNQGLRSSWEAQIAEKERRSLEERDSERRWRDVNFLKNESSDDEA